MSFVKIIGVDLSIFQLTFWRCCRERLTDESRRKFHANQQAVSNCRAALAAIVRGGRFSLPKTSNSTTSEERESGRKMRPNAVMSTISADPISKKLSAPRYARFKAANSRIELYAGEKATDRKHS